jgi:hypothetical protein
MKASITLITLGLAVATSVYRVSAEDPKIAYTGSTTWDETAKTLTFEKSGEMRETQEDFYWTVPDNVRRIVIQKGVTVTGGFRVGYREPSNPLHIEGADRETSVLFGTPDKQWTTDEKIPENDKWKYGAIAVLADATVYVSTITSRNPRSYHVSGYANRSVIHVDECTLLDDRGGDNNNSDGFIGAAGSSIRNSLIDTLDDGIKIYQEMHIENVTIRQYRNGAAIQFGWGGETGDVKATIRNLTIIGADPMHRYNMAPFTWEGGSKGSRTIEADGLKVRFSGEIYNESSKEWEEAGLFELKPAECTVTFRAVNADLAGLQLGRRDTKGEIQLAPVSPAKTRAEREAADQAPAR